MVAANQSIYKVSEAIRSKQEGAALGFLDEL
jgi:hypothetical protein